MKIVIITIFQLLLVIAHNRADATSLRTSTTTGDSRPSSFTASLEVQRTTILGRREFQSTIQIGVGTPPQIIPMVFDTGSFYPVVYNKTCTLPDCGTAPKFNAAKSSSISVSKDNFKLAYGAGTTEGKYATDVFSFPTSSGITTADHLRQPRLNFTQKFGLVDFVQWAPDQNGSNVNMSGIFGMGLHGNPRYPDSDPHAFRTQLGIDEFAIWLPRGDPQETKEGSSVGTFQGEVQFGGYDLLPPRNNGRRKEPAWSQLSSYLFNYLDDFLVNGKSTGLCSSAPQACGGFFDTGGETMQLYGFGLHKILPSTTFSCDGTQFKNLPNLTFVINGTHLTFEPRDYVMRLKNGTCENTILTGAYLKDQEAKDTRRSTLTDAASESISNKWKKFKHPFGQKKNSSMISTLNSDIYNEESSSSSTSTAGMIVPSSGLFDMGIMWTARILTIWNSRTNQVGFIQHD